MMDRVWQTIQNASVDGTEFSVQAVLLSLMLAFVLGQLLAWLYYFTHTGLSYSRSFVQSLILITVIVSMVMSTIAGSFVVAVGLMGALSIIRFRNIIKDTRDIAFIFSALVIGMAAGSQRYSVAILRTGVIGSIILYLHLSEFGTHRPHNAFLRFGLWIYRLRTPHSCGPEKILQHPHNDFLARRGLWRYECGICLPGND